MTNIGPTLPFSIDLHAMKYRAPGEVFREAMNRVAGALADNDTHYNSFRQMLHYMIFMPAGRVQAAVGSTKNVTPYNCFVSGEIHDSFVDGPDLYSSDDNPDSISIMQAATEAAQTMRQGGGIGFDFSPIRPSGDIIKGVQAVTEGPCSFMPIFDSVCGATSSSGNRRGAMMATLRVDHPDIERFINLKHNETALRGFNLSILITDEFMECVKNDSMFWLRWGGKNYRQVNAKALWDTIMRSTWDWAEPGVLFIDTINKHNNLWYCETIAATNPCGEQPLPPYGACLLGSFNLPKYVREVEGLFVFDLEQFKADIPDVVRAMDNIIDKATYPLAKQAREAKNKRRMGLGYTGLANALEACGHLYGSNEFKTLHEIIAKTLAVEAYRASALLAKEKGAFPLFDRDKYLQGTFIQKLPRDVYDLIAKYGTRNSHLISVAPTGTISLSADNVSSGAEPVFAYESERTSDIGHGAKQYSLPDYAFAKWGVQGKTSAEVTADEHVQVLLTASEWVDSAVSKTCNVAPDMPWEDFKDIYFKAWEGGAKGCTTFNSGGKRFGILKAVEKDDDDDQEDLFTAPTCEINEHGIKSCE